MSDFLPKGQLQLYEALDLVGKGKFGDYWLGVENYNSAYDATVEGGFPNPKEADRRAREDYSRCRAATLKLRQLLFGMVPDHDDAVPAIFLASTGAVTKIDAHVWGSEDALKLFRTCRIKYRTANLDFVPWSTREAAGTLEGRILVSERHLKNRLDDSTNRKSRKSRPKKLPRPRSAGKRELVARALDELYGERAKWPKVSKLVLAQINDRLKAKGLGRVGIDTLRRAIEHE